MTVYAIGDIQGCFAEFMALLEALSFAPSQDTLWFTGDLVNRGPNSLAVLRYIKNLPNKIVVLGNHDLHLIALSYGVQLPKRQDTLQAILDAPDRIDLIEWLRHQPLAHFDPSENAFLSHAGLAPCWDIKQAMAHAEEVNAYLSGTTPATLLQEMYGNYPDQWQEDLEGMPRLRCIINYLTRMRFCYVDGRLNLTYKGTLAAKPIELMPWFDVPNRIAVNSAIIFGHWAALGGKADVPQIYPLDTGCVWGNSLTALRLQDKKRFSVACMTQ